MTKDRWDEVESWERDVVGMERYPVVWVGSGVSGVDDGLGTGDRRRQPGTHKSHATAYRDIYSSNTSPKSQLQTNPVPFSPSHYPYLPILQLSAPTKS